MSKTILQIKRITVGLLAILIVFVMSVPFGAKEAKADDLTSEKDILSTLTESVVANHTISFVTPTGVANAETITLTFDSSFTMGSVDEDDVDIVGDTYGELTTEADCDGSDEASVVFASYVMTITLCSGDSALFIATETVTIEVGDHATSSGTGSNQITNPSASNDVPVDIAGTQTDSGALALSFIADDSVAVSAQVDPTITFSISDVAIGFGDLSSSTGRWANSGATGDDASDPATPTAAHTMAISTNADNGWAITYNGATLTSGSNTIDVASSIDEDSDGTQNSEEFGISASTSDNATIASGYERDGNADWNFVASTTTTLVSETIPTATETISMSYLANIAGNTEAGDYSTSITYIATAIF